MSERFFSKERISKNIKTAISVSAGIAIVATSVGCSSVGIESPSSVGKNLTPVTAYPETPIQGIDFEYQLVQAAKESEVSFVKIDDLINNPEKYSGQCIETEGLSFWQFTGGFQGKENTLSENYRFQADTNPKSKFIWLEQLVETSEATAIAPEDTLLFNGKLKFRGTVQEFKDQDNKISYGIELNEVISFEKSDSIIAPVRIK